MKEEYDFSNGERGKFYNQNAKFNLPIYLEPEIESFIAKLAKEQKKILVKWSMHSFLKIKS